jgi:hypothetical protein
MRLGAKGNLLKHYVMIRWRCLEHGWFETGTLIFQQRADCPLCSTPAGYVEHCDGMTTRSLPFTTKVRDAAAHEEIFAINAQRKPVKPPGM